MRNNTAPEGKPSPIAKLQEALAEVRKIYPRMELGQLDLLLTIALHPGLTGSAIVGKMGVHVARSGFYKTLGALGSEQARGSQEGRTIGLGLIERVQDPGGGRVHLLKLSSEGETLMSRIASILSCENEANRDAVP